MLGLKVCYDNIKSDFITTENYHIRLKPETSKKLIEAIKNNFNQRYIYKNKQYALEIIMLENIKEFAKYLSNNKKRSGLLYSRNKNNQK